jgi:glycosyltransferase involved in cell wall biosynthesis
MASYCETATLHHALLRNEHFVTYDVIILQRLGGNSTYIDQKWLDSFKELHKNNPKTKILYTIDDKLLSPVISQLMKESDSLLLPNKKLGEFYYHINPNQIFFNCFIDTDTFYASPKIRTRGKINILWASSAKLGSKFMEGIIQELKNFPNVILTSMGHIEKERWDNNHHILPISDYGTFCGYCRGSDIVLNPTECNTPEDKSFVDCKSAIKYMHAALSKSLLISSKTYPYEQVIQNYENGILLDNDTEYWLDAIEDFIRRPQTYEHILDKAQYDVSYQYSLTKVSNDIFNAIR